MNKVFIIATLCIYLLSGTAFASDFEYEGTYQYVNVADILKNELGLTVNSQIKGLDNCSIEAQKKDGKITITIKDAKDTMSLIVEELVVSGEMEEADSGYYQNYLEQKNESGKVNYSTFQSYAEESQMGGVDETIRITHGVNGDVLIVEGSSYYYSEDYEEGVDEQNAFKATCVIKK